MLLSALVVYVHNDAEFSHCEMWPLSQNSPLTTLTSRLSIFIVVLHYLKSIQ